MFRTIRFRMTVWYAALLLLGFAGLGAFLYLNLSRSLYDDLDRHLRDYARWVETYLAASPADPDFGDLQREMIEHATPRTAHMRAEVRRANGHTVFRSSRMKSYERLPVASTGMRTVTFRQTPHRCWATTAQGYTILVAAPEDDVRSTLRRLRNSLFIVAPAVVWFASIGGWFLAGRLLRPVDALTRRAQQVSGANLSVRLTVPDTQDEIARLAHTLNQMMTRIEDAFSRLRQFTADASHELRTPLTVLRGEIEVALRRSRTSEEYQRVLASALEEVNHLSKIVEDLITLSQADAGKATLLTQPVALDKIVRDVVERCQPLADAKGVTLSCDTVQPVAVRANEDRIRQLLFNLIGNGIKYTSSGGRVTVGCEMTNGRMATLTVADTGIGIPSEHLPHIFERFYRVDKARSREMGGSGLGLSICQWIAQAHDGHITVESEPNRGSTFRVHLPAQD